VLVRGEFEAVEVEAPDPDLDILRGGFLLPLLVLLLIINRRSSGATYENPLNKS
jgi:hypothetical protein